MKYYDWGRTLSYTQARVYAVIGGKGIGKTFGIRKIAIDDFISKGLRLVEICRYAADIPQVSADYVLRLNERGYFKQYEFLSKSDQLFIKGGKFEDWELCGYFVGLSSFQQIKKRTFSNIGKMIFDECVIDPRDRYHSYLPDEIGVLSNAVDSITREQPGEKHTAQLFLLGNSCDASWIYLPWLGLSDLPKRGYTWCLSGNAVIHNADPIAPESRISDTLSGIMLSNSKEKEMVFYNKFDMGNTREYIAEKPDHAGYYMGIVLDGFKYAIYADYGAGLMYVDTVEKLKEPIYFLRGKDGSLNYNLLKKRSTLAKFLRGICDEQLIRYTTLTTKTAFSEVLKLIGCEVR